MFETLYSCTRTVARHANGPAAVSRLSYLEHLVAGGATVHSLRQNAGVMYRAAVFMGLDDSSPVERTAIEKAAKDWANRQYPNAMSIGPEIDVTPGLVYNGRVEWQREWSLKVDV